MNQVSAGLRAHSLNFCRVGALAIFLFLPVTSSAHVTREKGRCGPNVDRGLMGILEATYTFFDFMSDDQKRMACRQLYLGDFPERAPAQVWDVSELRIGASLEGEPVLDCSDTVEISLDGNRRCAHGWAVNYAAWGVMNTLCARFSKAFVHYPALMRVGVVSWKVAHYKGRGVAESMAWTNFGASWEQSRETELYRRPFDFPVPGEVPELAKQCPVRTSVEEENPNFKSKWAGFRFSVNNPYPRE